MPRLQENLRGAGARILNKLRLRRATAGQEFPRNAQPRVALNEVYCGGLSGAGHRKLQFDPVMLHRGRRYKKLHIST